MSEYEEAIALHDGMERVRKRPGMFVGGTDAFGLHNMLWAIAGNVVDLHLAQYVTTVHVDVTPDSWITVRDDGPGISGRDLTSVCTKFHPGGTLDGHLPHVHITTELVGVDIAAVNALSTELEIESTFEGVRHRQTFARGVPTSPLTALASATLEGTSIRFHPDPDIFKTIALDVRAIRDRLQELAWLNPLLRIFFQGERLSGRGGVRGWAESLATQRGGIDAIFATRSVVEQVSVDVAVMWGHWLSPTIHSFVNMNRSVGGTHVDGLWSGFAACARALGSKDASIETARENMSGNLVAIVHVGLYHPKFGNPTKELLLSPEAGAAVARTLSSDLVAELGRNKRLRDFLGKRLGISDSEP